MPGQHERTEPVERDLPGPDAVPGLVAQGDAPETDRSPWQRYGTASATTAVATPPDLSGKPAAPAGPPAEPADPATDVTGEDFSSGNDLPASDHSRTGGESAAGDDSGAIERPTAGGPPDPDGAATEAGDSVGQGSPGTAKTEPASHKAGAPPDSGPGTGSAGSSQMETPHVPAGTPGPVTPRPARGSLADLRQRLERLPSGHPSSPYHVDGERKSPPPRLKHLELAPPQPARTVAVPVLAAGSGQRPGDADASDPGTPDADGAWLDIALRTPDWEDVPTLLAVTAGPRDSTDLTEDQLRLADEAYDRLRAAQGRDLFGADTGTGLTAAIRRVSEQLAHGTLAPGSEEHALIGPEEFRARYADLIRRHPERSAESLADRVPGALSYSFVLDASLYAAGIWLVQDALEAAGFQLRARRNGWNGATDKCVVSLWRDPDSGALFSVQFHTAASLEAQHLARTSAALIADPRIPRAEAENLAGDLAGAWAALPAPPGTSHISDYADSPGPGLP
ncbi:MAG: hypothetical protein ACYCO9_07015 [Streptosporangiaceae bacterium]